MTRIRLANLSAVSFLIGMLFMITILTVTERIDPPQILLAGATSDTHVLVAPRERQDVSLMSHEGEVLHQWSLRRSTTGTVELLPDNSLMFIANDREGEVPRQPTGANGIGLRRVSWDGDLEWSHPDSRIHHDWEVLPDGTVAAIRAHRLPAEFAARIGGGIAGSDYEDGTIWADQVIEIDPATHEAEVVFDVAEALEPENHPLPAWMHRVEWTHANGLTYTEADPLTGEEAYLISFRAINTIVMVSRRTGEAIWTYGGQWVLNQQHDPSFLPNGNVLVFDNGQYRRGEPSGSQVLEIDPRTNEIVWAFPESLDPFNGLYSSIISGAQRLRNGNTLVTYGVPGRLLEVTPHGTIVWDAMPAPGNAIFKARAYPSERFPDAVDG